MLERPRSIRRRTFEVLEESPPGDRVGAAFDRLLIALILVNIAALIVETVEPVRARAPWLFLGIEAVSVAIFTVEYVARVWSCVERPDFAGPVRGRLRFMRTPLAVIDLLAVLPFYLALSGMVDLRFLRAMRLLRLLRVLKLTRYVRALTTFRDVVAAKREQLAIALGALFVLLIGASCLMYFAEAAAQPEVFSSIPASMWWAIATLTTVGYGDVVPVTAIGQLLGAGIAILGIGMFALPASILASGFMEHIESAEPDAAPRPAGAAPGEAPMAASPPSCPHCGEPLDRLTR